MRKPITTGIFALALSACLTASAQVQKQVRVYRDGNYWVEEMTGSIPAGKTFGLTSAVGSVRVQGATQQNVTFTIKKKISRSAEDVSRRDMENFAVSILRRGEAVVMEADWPRQRSGRLNAEFYITVPKETALARVETLGGSVEVKNITGKGFARTAGGSISMDEIGGSATANTMGGSIDVGKIGGDAKLETAGGSINIGWVNGMISAVTNGGSIQIGTGRGAITVETAGGSISVNKCNGELRATTAGGTIDIGDVTAGARLESAGGGIRLGSAGGIVSANTASGGIRLKNLTRGVTAETMSGPIEAEFTTTLGAFTDSRLETTVGDIVVYLPSDLAATIKASIEVANGHNIISDFDGLKVVKEGAQFGPREVYADGKINGGGPVLKLHTTNGNIEIRKSKARK